MTKALEFTATSREVFPTSPQDAGVQGDDNAVEVRFMMDDTLAFPCVGHGRRRGAWGSFGW